jgi:hypothetical protein
MNLRTSLRPVLLAAAAAAWLSPASASASLVYLGPSTDFGTGIGNVDTVLSTRPQGSGTATCGQITFGDVTANCGGAETIFAGGSNNQTYTFGELGITDAAQLRFTFNVNESDDLVTLDELAALFYTSAGALYHTAVYEGPTDFLEVGSGIGSQGHVFGLSPAEIIIVNAQLAASNVVGARFNVSGASGGFETLNVWALDDEVREVPGDDVPEPTSLLLLGSAMLGMGLFARRR